MLIADDGSTNRQMVEQCQETVSSLPHVRFIIRRTNSGRAAIRNFLVSEAQYPWLLFLDGDMTIPNDRFLQNYLDCDALIAYGGYNVGQGSLSNLRFRYEKACEPQHRPDERRKRPFQHFHTSNFIISRDIIIDHPFDERFRHYGYEDVLFGKKLKQEGIAIEHIDNPMMLSNVEPNDVFVAKTEESLRTLYSFHDDLRGYSKLLTFVSGIHIRPVKSAIRLWHKLLGPIERRHLCGSHPTLRVFNIYKTGYYLSLTNND